MKANNSAFSTLETNSLGSGKITFLMIIIILATGILIYSNSLYSPFILDDISFIAEDNAVHLDSLEWERLLNAAIDGKPRNRFIPNFTFGINYYFHQYNTLGYHIVNIAIHLITGILLFLFTCKTIIIHRSNERRKFDTRNSDCLSYAMPMIIAFFASLLWVAWPVNTNAVTYICQRMTSLCALFFLLSLVCYIHARDISRQNNHLTISSVLLFIGSFFCAVCAVLTKQNAATLPFFILLYEWLFFQNNREKQFRIFILCFAGLVIFTLIISFHYLGINPFDRIMKGYEIRQFNLLQRVLTEFRVVIYYISLICYPHPSRLNLDHFYPLSFRIIDPPATLISLTAIIFCGGLAISFFKKK